MNRLSQITWYNTGYGLWMAALSIQQLVVTWIMVGIMGESPERVGMAQMLIGIPGLAILLWAGAVGDRTDARQLLIRVHYLSAIPPLLLALAITVEWLSLMLLIVLALVASILSSLANPSRHAILNRVAGRNLQVAISLSTAIGAIASMAGSKLGGEIESMSIAGVLMLQAGMFAIGGLATAKLHPGEPIAPSAETSLATVKAGLSHLIEHRLARDVISLNFLSSLFNAGAWMTAIPFIVVRVYDGNAVQLANLTVVFYFGSLIANFTLLRFMPLQHPGKLYLVMQLSRILALLLIWFEPPVWGLAIAAAYWGFNMGVTSTMSRLMVQEIAEPEFRTRLVSIYTLGQLGAMPVGALVLGHVIGWFGPLNALLPGVVASVAIFAIGVWGTQIWRYRSPAAS
ncbi:MAG: MFS transporter [Proteobacteria bacterium]|nr:MFS transporter [Pseudomonadota bacterium]